jgi:hypothetical protein
VFVTTRLRAQYFVIVVGDNADYGHHVFDLQAYKL